MPVIPGLPETHGQNELQGGSARLHSDTHFKTMTIAKTEEKSKKRDILCFCVVRAQKVP